MGTSVVVAYVWAVVISLALLLIAIIIANLIPNRPGGKDISQRRMWFWVLFVVTAVASFGVNFWIANGIKIPSKHADFMLAAAISAGVAVVIYVLLGFILSKAMKRSKLGTWF